MEKIDKFNIYSAIRNYIYIVTILVIVVFDAYKISMFWSVIVLFAILIFSAVVGLLAVTYVQGYLAEKEYEREKVRRRGKRQIRINRRGVESEYIDV